MKRSTPIIALILLALAITPVCAEGWLWNPFAKKEEKSIYPKWPPQPKMPSASAPKPTTWQKMSNGTKKAFDWMNPFDGNPTANKSTSAAPRNSFISNSSKPIGNKPQSVPEFLSQPRPGRE